MYSVRGRSAAANLGLTNEAIAALWNGHSTQAIYIVQLSIVQAVAPASGRDLEWRRISARGTPGSTVVPDISNDSKRGIAPPSGVVLDLASYSVQPTIDGGPLGGYLMLAVIGDGGSFSFLADAPPAWSLPGFDARVADVRRAGLLVPPSSGVAIVKGITTSGVEPCEVSFVWVEDL